MDYHYAYKYFVGYSDIDKTNKIKLSRVIDLLQNVATWHSESIGYGTSRLMKLKFGWLLLAWKIKIFKYPKVDEKIEIRTWSKKPKGLHVYRDFEIIDENGEVLILAKSSWVLYDLANRKPIKMFEDMASCYGVIERDAFEEEISKVKIENVSGKTLEIKPMKRDIDTNNHVNNARYIDFFEEVLSEDIKIKEIEVQYKNQTMFGEKLKINFDGKACTIQNEDGELKVEIIIK